MRLLPPMLAELAVAHLLPLRLSQRLSLLLLLQAPSLRHQLRPLL